MSENWINPKGAFYISGPVTAQNSEIAHKIFSLVEICLNEMFPEATDVLNSHDWFWDFSLQANEIFRSQPGIRRSFTLEEVKEWGKSDQGLSWIMAGCYGILLTKLFTHIILIPGWQHLSNCRNELLNSLDFGMEAYEFVFGDDRPFLKKIIPNHQTFLLSTFN